MTQDEAYEAYILEDKIVVDGDEGTIYLPPQLEEFLKRGFKVTTWPEGWFDGCL